jgi:HAD superfamily hydrolase (TIGR01484 family)
LTSPVRLLLADVDGTLVTMDKSLTDRTVEAVHRLHDAGVAFAVTSGRPPRGMSMLVEPLALQTPLASFNGGLIVDPDMSVVEERTVPDDIVAPMVELLESFGLDAWLYRGADWFVRDPDGPHVAREAQTVQFAPSVVDDFGGLMNGIAKIVGVSDDHDVVATAARAAHDEFGDHVSAARSQDYYLDVTHPDANKGGVVTYLAGARRILAAMENAGVPATTVYLNLENDRRVRGTTFEIWCPSNARQLKLRPMAPAP